MEQNNLTLGIPSFTYADLYNAARLKDLLDVFDASVKHHDVELYDKFSAYRQHQGEGLKPEEISDLLLSFLLAVKLLLKYSSARSILSKSVYINAILL